MIWAEWKREASQPQGDFLGLSQFACVSYLLCKVHNPGQQWCDLPQTRTLMPLLHVKLLKVKLYFKSALLSAKSKSIDFG